MRDKSLPSRLVAVKVVCGEPNMSGSIVIVSMALMKLSVVRPVPALAAALANMSMIK